MTQDDKLFKLAEAVANQIETVVCTDTRNNHQWMEVALRFGDSPLLVEKLELGDKKPLILALAALATYVRQQQERERK